MKWPSPWGEGFPGWHIECSAMSMRYLGETLDLHTGGIDHVPVHHTNEIAQSEAATGRPFVRGWLHSAFLLVEGQKMSKSLGNLFTLEDVVARGFAPLALRYLFLSGLYRKEMNFTWAALAAAQAGLTRLWQRTAELPPPAGEPLGPALDAFEAPIGSDVSTTRALAALWDAVRADAPPAQVAATVREMDRVFGLDLDRAAERLRELDALQPDSGREQVEALAAERARLRHKRRSPRPTRCARRSAPSASWSRTPRNCGHFPAAADVTRGRGSRSSPPCVRFSDESRIELIKVSANRVALVILTGVECPAPPGDGREGSGG